MDVAGDLAASGRGRSPPVRDEGVNGNGIVESLYRNALSGNIAAQCFWLKNRRPSEWRDVQNVDAAIGHYLISDRPLTEAEWIEQRTKALPQVTEQVIEAEATVPDDDSDFGTARTYLVVTTQATSILSIA